MVVGVAAQPGLDPRVELARARRAAPARRDVGGAVAVDQVGERRQRARVDAVGQRDAVRRGLDVRDGAPRTSAGSTA